MSTAAHTPTKGRPAARLSEGATDVLIVGAGPVGLTLANLLGARGVRVLVIEQLDALIDYPRGVGLDDESLRTFQGIGLAGAAQQHTIPNQILRFINGKGQLLAELAPSASDFGWPKRNGFVQPLVDAELLTGLQRFGCVQVLWAHQMEAFEEEGQEVAVTVRSADGVARRIQAKFLVGCDGGRSATRSRLKVSFDGTTSSTRWLVVDIENDPIGSPNSYVCADPRRPYVSISIAHGIRRFEFMLMDDESDEDAENPDFLQNLLRSLVPRPEEARIIRHRVYTHHSRIASSFRRGRVLLAGDAAHLMPVWQGQGYNSGIRDAANLGWKLSAVIQGFATEELLSSYDQERRGHARAMIDLSTTVGRFVSVRNRPLAWLRDQIARAASATPALKRYVVEMRFKPMPRYDRGAVLAPGRADSPVGRLFIQPEVETVDGVRLLDDVLGNWFAVVCWNNDPLAILDKEALALWRHLGAKLVSVVPRAQLNPHGDASSPVQVIGDVGALKAWFDRHEESVVFLRPDRCVAAACIAQDASRTSAELGRALNLTYPSPGEAKENRDDG